MSRSWWGKFFLLCFCIVLSGIYVYPTLGNLDLDTTKFPFKKKINLGLDLQGGLYLVLGIDFDRVYKDIVDRQVASLRDRLKDKGIKTSEWKALDEGFAKDDPRISVDFDSGQRSVFYEILKKEFWTLRLTSETSGHFELGLSPEYLNEVRERTLNQSIEVIRNRVDEFGVSEPSITSQGSDRVVVELPGVREIDRAKDLIGRTAKLEFKVVNDKMESDKLEDLVAEIEEKYHFTYKEGQKFSDYVRKLNELAKPKIPNGNEIAFEKVQAGQGEDEDEEQNKSGRIPYLLYSKAEVTGDDLQDASVQIDPENRRPDVGFSLNPRGATLFDKLTSAHVGHQLAIVLDGMIHSAPVIQSRIRGGKGQITLGRGSNDELMREAKDLAIVLRAGALPAQLDFLEQRVVGPSLGQDSIHKGALASLIGSMAVFLFVAVYYQVSGLIAVASLLLNVLFVLACLIGLDATLTLPGIAGIALTVGIAVDSNVVIYERIREELRNGRMPHRAVEAGFQKAFRTILDANVTNAAAGAVLLMFGTGPIRGFAVTLLIGIVTTLFTAVFACRLIFDVYLKLLEERGARTLSI